MAEKMKFHSYSAGQDFELTLDKGFIFVFGGNGCGKTTLSRCFQKDSLVFNSDFINKNIYITDANDGTKISQDNRKNFSRLFIGETTVKFAEEIAKISKFQKEVDNKVEELENNMGIMFANNYTSSEKDLSSVLSDCYSFDTKEPIESISQAKSKYSVTKPLETTIHNDNELKQAANQLKERTLFESLNKEIESDVFLKAVLIDHHPYLDSGAIERFNGDLVEIAKEESIFAGIKSKENYKTWLRNGISLQADNKECLFCNSNKGQEAKTKWSSILDSKFLKEKENLRLTISNNLNSLKKITEKQSDTKKLFQKIVTTCEQLFNALSNALQSVNSNHEIMFEIVKTQTDQALQEVADVSLSVRNYLINNNYLPSYYLVLLSAYLKQQIVTKEKELDKELVDYSAKAKATINECLKLLGSDKEVNLKTLKYGSHTISWEPLDDLSPSQYSDGERRKLALAMFFANILDSNQHYESIVLDDPVDSLDSLTYYHLRNFLIQKKITDDCDRLIILTHNIHYLYIQASNLIQNAEFCLKTHIYELRPRKFEAVPLSFFQMDDIAVFKNLLNNINEKSHLVFLPWLANRLSRLFLNLRISMEGKVPKDDIAPNLKELGFQDIQASFNELDHISRKSTLSNPEVAKSLEEFNKIISTMGFPELVQKKTIRDIQSWTNPIEMKPAAADFCEEMVEYGMAFEKKGSPQKNYLEHPRYQITESLLAISASDSD